MEKQNQKVDVKVSFSIDTVRAAAKNADSLPEVVLDVPCVDPFKLTLGTKIYGLKIVPVQDDPAKRIEKEPAMTIGVVDYNVTSLSQVKEGFITVNNVVDIPQTIHGTRNLSDIYLASKEDARMVARIFIEEEADRVRKAIALKEESLKYLEEQLNNDRF